MTPILPIDSLARVMFLLSADQAEVSRGLAEADRRVVEVVVSSACHGPVARDEYLAALALSAGDRPGEAAVGPYEPPAWEALLRDGLPGLTGRDLLALAASPAALRELSQRLGAALLDGTLTDIWWSYYAAFPLPPDPVLDERLKETVEDFRRLHAEWTERSGRAKTARPTDAGSID